MKTSPLRSLAHLLLVGAITLVGASAQPTIFNDSPNDIDAGISTGGGTLDILAMEVTDTVEDVVFTLTVAGNIVSTDWGKFMIGIATTNSPGTLTGNGWGRPINLNAGGGNGMTRWIGSWVNGGGGSQLWTYGGTSWSNTGPVKTFSTTPGTQSQIIYTVTKASLGVATGDTIYFDAYSSGDGGGDSAVDALSNPNISITSWSQPYTSQAPTISSYTLSNSAVNVTTDVTFRVDMTAQIAIGTFNPAAGDVVSADWGNGFLNFLDLTDPELDGVYEGTASITAAEGTQVAYRFTIVPFDTALPLIPESVSRSFAMPAAPLALPVVFFNNAQGYRNVTFTVDMSIQESLGTFNPATQVVEVRGPFNNWAGTTMSAAGGGLYNATVLIGGANASSVEYKYFATGALGYESISGNRSFALELNQDGNPNPAQVLTPVFFSNQTAFRDVTFTVDMSVQQALGLFDPETATVELRSGSFGPGDARQMTRQGTTPVYSLTFGIPGAEGDLFSYKFYSAGINYFVETDPANAGYEIINQADPFENRQITLAAPGAGQTVPQAYFSNQRLGLMDTQTAPLPNSSLVAFSSTQGTPSLPQSVAVSGSGLTSDIVANAPSGFEVSSDGIAYAASANIPAPGGVVNSAAVYVRVAASAPSGSISGRVTLQSDGSQTTSVAVSGTVTASGQTFSQWSGGQPVTQDLLLKYAIGGASSPTATNGVPSVTTVTADTLSITAVVRTNDPTLTVNGQTLVNLAVGPWSTNNVTMTPQPGSPAPEGCQVQVFSTPRGTDGRKFLRLQTTLPPTP